MAVHRGSGVTKASYLLEPNLQTAVTAVSDRLGEQVILFLKCEMNDTALCRIEHAKSEWPSVLSDLIGSETGHCVKLGLSRLAKTFCINNEAVFPIEVSSVDLKKYHLECVQ